MIRRSLIALLVICVLSALIFVLQILALRHHLYYTFWWYDVMMHFLGGLIVGGGAVWAVRRFAAPPPSAPAMLMCALAGALAIGVSWEVFERLAGMLAGRGSAFWDTAGDI